MFFHFRFQKSKLLFGNFVCCFFVVFFIVFLKTYFALGNAIDILVNDIYKQSQNNDILLTLLLTDEYLDNSYNLSNSVCNDNN